MTLDMIRSDPHLWNACSIQDRFVEEALPAVREELGLQWQIGAARVGHIHDREAELERECLQAKLGPQ